MADLVRSVTIGRGLDPREFALLAIGGAGPLHVGAYGRDAGVQAIIVPDHASEFSALGIATKEDLVFSGDLSWRGDGRSGGAVPTCDGHRPRA